MLDRRSIRFQLLVLALAAVAPLAAVLAYVIATTANESLESGRREAMGLAAGAAGDLGHFVANTSTSLAALSGRPLIRALDPARCDPILRDVSAVFPSLQFPDLDNVGIRDLAGRSVCSSIAVSPSSSDVARTPAFQAALRKRGFDLSGAFMSPVSGRWVSMSTHPIRGADGEIAALFLLRIDLLRLQERLLHAPAEGNTIAVVDGNARYLMRAPDPQRWIGKAALDESVLRERTRTREPGFERLVGADGIARLYAFHPVAGTGWMAVAGIPEERIFSRYRERLAQGIAIGIAALLLALLLAMRISRAIARPILGLAATAARIADGERDARAELRGPREVAAVAREFNRMIDATETVTRQERESFERFSKIFAAAPLPMSITSISRGEYYEINEAFCEWFGARREEVIGRTVAEIGIYVDPQRRIGFAAELAAGRGVRDLELQYRVRSGAIRDVLVNAESIQFQDAVAALVIITDVTERKRVEEDVREVNASLERRVAARTAELEAANEQLEGFARTIAHDLRAPLRAISRFGDELRRKLGSTLDRTGADYLDRVARNVTRMDNMLTDMLDFARSGQAALKPVPIDMARLAAQVAEELTAEAPSAPQVTIGALPAIPGDPSLVRQVWSNLVANAIKFSAGASPPRIEIGARPGVGEVEYYVRDNGCGFDPAYADKLFGVFQRLHSESEFEGNGVGLAIVHRIVERHGGRVAARSAPGVFAEFSFTLPQRALA